MLRQNATMRTMLKNIQQEQLRSQPLLGGITPAASTAPHFSPISSVAEYRTFVGRLDDAQFRSHVVRDSSMSLFGI